MSELLLSAGCLMLIQNKVISEYTELPKMAFWGTATGKWMKKRPPLCAENQSSTKAWEG